MPEDQIKLAIRNRREFLAPYKERFENAGEKERADIIIELIKLEPSHLTETWILDTVIDWLRDRKCSDYLEAAFIAQKDRHRPTELEEVNRARDYFLAKEIDKICGGSDATKEEAFTILARRQVENPRSIFPMYDPSNPNQQLELQIKKAYYRHRRRMNSDEGLPSPYYGREITVSDKNGRKLWP